MTKLTGMLFVLLFTAPVYAQQLIPQDDRKDPCRRFKMRVLVPPENDREIVTKPSELIDPKMVWNPCERPDVQIASINPANRPSSKNNFLVVDAGANPQKLKFVPIKPAPFLIIRPTRTQP